MSFRDILIAKRACSEAIEWVGDRTAQEAWDECPRGDWMLNIGFAMGRMDNFELFLLAQTYAKTKKKDMKNLNIYKTKKFANYIRSNYPTIGRDK
jgi:hypothetical protein